MPAPGELPVGDQTYGAPWAAGVTSFMPLEAPAGALRRRLNEAPAGALRHRLIEAPAGLSAAA